MEYIKSKVREDKPLPPVLILPALSIGNVGQLATDLLISEPSVIKAGFLDDPFVLPCIGNDPIGPTPVGSLTVALEVFEDTKNGLTIVQQRSPVVRGAMVEYAKHLAEWAESVGVKEVVILSGLNSGKRDRKEMMEGPQVYYCTTDTNTSVFQQLRWKTLEHSEALQHADELVQGPGEDFDGLNDENYYAGQPFSLLYSCCKARGLKVTCLLSFCAEGDNIPDAFFVVKSLQTLLQQTNGAKFDATTATIPLSWATVYGPPPDDSIW
ncbi:proteasome assembly chaperone 2 [Marchantia polymorpha subsp. ruderalis]|uniref:Proteasome assembly chaperone 2 n=2 Tax=Marchantia polymorpha TaxID=3197 RepID=A0AAF6BJS5_MARPO|nr:hypothetical protein MARPO_0073s0081 [Marchantia polymorpha]BBN12259.1 hypothetical protein Mp_5g18590 [Marchantia polymorpha subsp. ruderalis]|eukprot:PTQ35216.1 hypothetical protein MARPO_0073s0081 [Marchantia polymorpha]